MSHWPSSLYPHAFTEPSVRSAMVWNAPPAIAVHGPRSKGMEHWPFPLDPHALTVPSVRSAMV